MACCYKLFFLKFNHPTVFYFGCGVYPRVLRFRFCFSLHMCVHASAVIICYFIALEGSYQAIVFCFDLQVDIANSLVNRALAPIKDLK